MNELNPALLTNSTPKGRGYASGGFWSRGINNIFNLVVSFQINFIDAYSGCRHRRISSTV